MESNRFEMRDKFTKEYNSHHKFCPKCANDQIKQTYVGIVFDLSNPDSYQDINRATCKCGWEGTIHDLVESLNE